MTQRLRLTVDGPSPLVLEMDAPPDGATDPALVPRAVPSRMPGVARFEVVVDGWRFEVDVEPSARAALRERATAGSRQGTASGRQVVRAQIPGRVIVVRVAEGEAVEAGEALLVLEAMKMENAVIAPWPGTIARVGVVAGQTVERGDELVVIE